MYEDDIGDNSNTVTVDPAANAIRGSNGGTQFVIPPLKVNDRIEDWELLFKAAVTGLLTPSNGEVLAIGLLPAYLNRRPAEVELVKEAISLPTINEAFNLLKTLDDPVDKYEMMQRVCRADWVPGTPIDDFYYELKQRSKKAGADLDLVISILISQLPKKVQSIIKTEFVVQKGTDIHISESGGRNVLVKIKEVLQERGIALDSGCRSSEERSVTVSAVRNENNIQTSEETTPVQTSNNDSVNRFNENRGRQNRGSYNTNRNGSSQNRNQNANSQNQNCCYICNQTGHFARACRNQFCQRCGVKGHPMRDCHNNVTMNKINESTKLPVKAVPDDLVVVDLSVNGKSQPVMIDSGGGVSVIDKNTVSKLNAKIKPVKGNLEAFDFSDVPMDGVVDLTFQIGSKEVNHRLIVIQPKKSKSVMILGRDFQRKFPRTVFDWANNRIQLGDIWYYPKTWLRGGNLDSRISVLNEEHDHDDKSVRIEKINLCNINPKLSKSEQEELRNLLYEFSDRIATDVKNPTVTTKGEHEIIVEPNSRPVKNKKFRVSPDDEKNICEQAQKMLDDGIARRSNSPWAHNVILVRKKSDGSQRFVVDYRELNKVTVKDSYPMPDVRDILDKMNGSG